jgi:UDP-glucose 4-epimerase
MTKILVTGGAGFIGSATIAELQKHGHDIDVIDGLSFGKRDFLTIPDAYFHQLDILNGDGLSEVIHKIDDPDGIIHLAAIHFIPYCNQHPFKSSNINIQGTINVLNAAQSLKNL